MSDKMTRDELLALHAEICDKARLLMKSKSQDYATFDDVFMNFRRGEVMGFATMEAGLMLRVMDKMSRIATFLKNGKLTVEQEGVEDSIEDIINYMVLLRGMLEERKANRPRNQ